MLGTKRPPVPFCGSRCARLNVSCDKPRDVNGPKATTHQLPVQQDGLDATLDDFFDASRPNTAAGEEHVVGAGVVMDESLWFSPEQGREFVHPGGHHFGGLQGFG